MFKTILTAAVLAVTAVGCAKDPKKEAQKVENNINAGNSSLTAGNKSYQKGVFAYLALKSNNGLQGTQEQVDETKKLLNDALVHYQNAHHNFSTAQSTANNSDGSVKLMGGNLAEVTQRLNSNIANIREMLQDLEKATIVAPSHTNASERSA